MTVAELRFLESLPKTLKDIAISLNEISNTLKEVESKLSASSNL